MGGEIRTNDLSSSLARAALERDLDAYCAFKLTRIASAVPVAGSQDHDGRLSTQLQRALESYASLLRGDERMVAAAHDALSQADAQVATAMGRR